MKHILFIHHAQGWGGAPINMVNIINSLDKNEFQVMVLLLKDSIISEKLIENNIPYKVASSWFYKNFYRYYSHTVPSFITWYRMKTQFITWLSWILSNNYFANRELKRFEFDLVHLNSSVLTDWIRPSKKYGKVIIHIQEPLSNGYFGLRHYYFTNQMKKYSDKIIAISRDNYKRVNIPEKTEIIYNYSIMHELNELSIDFYKTKKVLYLGGSEKIKGFYTLVDSLDYLDHDVQVYFAGSFKKNKKYEQKSIKKYIKIYLKRLLFYNSKEEKALQKMRNHRAAIEIGQIFDVNNYLDKVVCLVSPFEVSHFSRPIIEAFSRRKPAIASNVEGMDEIINNNENGLLFNKANPKALAKAINYLCNNPEIAKQMGDIGYKNARELYSQKNIKEIEKIYNSLFK